jgi:hypothetical protein
MWDNLLPDFVVGVQYSIMETTNTVFTRDVHFLARNANFLFIYFLSGESQAKKKKSMTSVSGWRNDFFCGTELFSLGDQYSRAPASQVAFISYAEFPALFSHFCRAAPGP